MKKIIILLYIITASFFSDITFAATPALKGSFSGVVKDTKTGLPASEYFQIESVSDGRYI